MTESEQGYKIDTRGWESARKGDTHLLVELTDICNCRCIMCKQSQSKTIHKEMPKQFMDFSIFIKILQDLKEKRMPLLSINPIWTGESTIHPDFIEMMYYMFNLDRQYGLFRGFIMNTNAISMDNEMADLFLRYAKYAQFKEGHFIRLYFSLEAINPKTYSRIKNVTGKNLKKAMENIDYLVIKRRKMGLLYPNLTFGFIVMDENKDEALDFVDYWENHLSEISNVPVEVSINGVFSCEKDSIYLRQLMCYGDPIEAINLHKDIARSMGIVIEKERVPFKDERKMSNFRPPCGALWRTPNIAVNGDVLPCCRDVQLTMVLGNIKKDCLYDVWHGDRIAELRLSHIKGEFDVSFQKWPTCRTCLDPEGGILSDEEIWEYLKSINKEELMEDYLKRKKRNFYI